MAKTRGGLPFLLRVLFSKVTLIWPGSYEQLLVLSILNLRMETCVRVLNLRADLTFSSQPVRLKF